MNPMIGVRPGSVHGVAAPKAAPTEGIRPAAPAPRP